MGTATPLLRVLHCESGPRRPRRRSRRDGRRRRRLVSPEAPAPRGGGRRSRRRRRSPPLLLLLRSSGLSPVEFHSPRPPARPPCTPSAPGNCHAARPASTFALQLGRCRPRRRLSYDCSDGARFLAGVSPPRTVHCPPSPRPLAGTPSTSPALAPGPSDPSGPVAGDCRRAARRLRSQGSPLLSLLPELNKVADALPSLACHKRGNDV